MSRSRLAQFSLDDRARPPLQWLSQTVMMTMVWLVTWNWVAPLLGVRVLNLGELVQSFFSVVFAITSPGVTPSQSLIEIMVGFIFWMIPTFAALSGVATIGSALWFGVRRWQRPAPATGGESA